MTDNYKIQYKPTGNIFTLPKNECDRIISDNPQDYEVLDKDYKAPEKPKAQKKSTVLESILEK